MVGPGEVLAAQASSSPWSLALYATIAILHGMGTGSGLGYAGLVLPHHINSSSALLLLSEDQGTWFVSVTPIAMVAGVLLSIPLSESLGRKKMFFMSNILSLLGYISLFLSPSFLALVVSRAVQCAGMGLGAMTTGVYLNEISTVRLRGPVSGCSMTSNVVGLLCYTALCIVLPIQYLCLALAANCLVVLLLLLLLPESPQWLMRAGREEEARTSLRRIRGTTYPGLEVEVEEIKQIIKDREALAKATLCQALHTRTFIQPMAVFTMVFIFVALCGNDTMMFFGPTFFSKIDIGIPGPQLATLPWLGFALGYSLSCPLMARMNRVTQFVTFTSIMSVAMFFFGAMLFLMARGFDDQLLVQVGLVSSLLVATTAYGMGVGAVPYTMVGEVFTPEHRSLGSCLAQVVR